ncbi:Coiled-coil domain-containing protein [Ooceraea biroi]|uniref:Coiled-coil domain-containing protein n=1 Tax=Ooceraea biroi TaxID=2015173 RepID=A0A026WP42_OOCBI|nr:Coiled-coil domain-containing protein [Ooceraea biroi]
MRLSQKIRDFKESCQLQTLSQEQTALESDLREFESNLHKYESATGSVGKPTSAASSSMENKRRHDYKEIQDFHALIAKTGHTNNWSDEDHLLFLKMRTKCDNIPALVAAVQTKCLDLTAETIVNHEAWYKVYLDLREKQRSTIREWRKQKETEKIKKAREGEMMIDILEGASPREKVNSNIAEKVSRVTDNRKKDIKKTEDTIDDSANRKKELIRRWRMEKENKRWMDEEQARILSESKLAAEEKRKTERFKRIQEALVEYREKKLVESSSKISENVSRPKYNPMLMTAFRKQDEEYTNKRKNLIERLRKPARNRTTKMVKSQVARRDYSTLMNSTKVWTERCKRQDRNAKEPKKLQYIKDVPRLYVL